MPDPGPDAPAAPSRAPRNLFLLTLAILFLEMAALTSILYLAMSYPLSLLSSWLERKLKS